VTSRITTETTETLDEGVAVVEGAPSPWWTRRGESRGLLSIFSDLVALTKPRITALVVTTTASGLWLGARELGERPKAASAALALLGTVVVVAGANALNMYLERDSDGLMERTKDRPLPAGRLPAEAALVLGMVCSAVSLPLLTFGVNAAAGLLAAIALLSYVLVYTPMKRKSPAALLVGAVPGAIPPLLGWAAATGGIGWPGLALFGLLFFWQIPHFLAIATFRREDYARAGLQVLPNVRGDAVTRRHALAHSVALFAVTLSLTPVAGPVYLATAVVLGLGFLGLAAWGLAPSAGQTWAKSLFAYSIAYLTLMLVVLAIGA
jgi:protoheme IX farnesyltransferase